MSSVETIIAQVEAAGGKLVLHGERIRCQLPENAAHLLEELRSHRNEVLFALKRREDTAGVLPARIRLLNWNLKQAPVVIDMCTVVTDTALFATRTFDQLRAALRPPKRSVGWTIPQLLDRLAKIGVVIHIEESAENHSLKV